MTDHYITTADLRDSVTQRRIAEDIIVRERTWSTLVGASNVVRTFWAPTRTGRIPIVTRNIPAHVNVDELQEIDVTRPVYSHYDYDLRKISVKIGISDEALQDQRSIALDQMASQIITPWDWQINDAAQALADVTEQQIIRAITHNPQHAVYNFNRQSFVRDVMPEVYRALAPYTPTACVMSMAARTYIVDLIGNHTNTEMVATVPYTGIPISGSNYMPDVSSAGETEIYFVSSEVPAVGLAKLAEPVEPGMMTYTREHIATRAYDDIDLGCLAVRIDAYRDIFGGVVKTATEANKGVVCVHIMPRDPEMAIVPDTADVGNKETQVFEAIYR